MIDRAALAGAWFRRSGGERAAIAGIASAAVLAIAIFAVLIPLTGAVQRARADLARTSELLDTARAHRSAEDALVRRAGETSGEAPATTVTRVLARYALVPLATPRSPAPDSVEVTIPAAPFDTLVRALGELALTANLRVERATLTALAQGGLLRADLVLRSGVTR